MTTLINFPQEVLGFIRAIGNIANDGDYDYYNLPYWFKKEEDGKVIQLDFGELPNNIKEMVENHAPLLRKDDCIKFAKWKFENCYVPNESFLWFDHRLSRHEVVFYKIEELFNKYRNE